MDYLRRLARLSQMNRIINETIITKMGMEKDILQEVGEEQLRGMPTSCEWSTAELRGRL
jgi:hypothetical protein